SESREEGGRQESRKQEGAGSQNRRPRREGQEEVIEAALHRRARPHSDRFDRGGPPAQPAPRGLVFRHHRSDHVVLTPLPVGPCCRPTSPSMRCSTRFPSAFTRWTSTATSRAYTRHHRGSAKTADRLPSLLAMETAAHRSGT